MNINELKDNISKYVYYDNYIREYKKKIDPIKNKRKQILDNIIYTIKMNNIPQLNVKLPDGNLGCIEKEIIAPLNNVYIKTMITNYFMENINDPNQIKAAQDTAENLIDYILNGRPVKKTLTLKRKYNK
jgi:hypothetical protein